MHLRTTVELLCSHSQVLRVIDIEQQLCALKREERQRSNLRECCVLRLGLCVPSSARSVDPELFDDAVAIVTEWMTSESPRWNDSPWVPHPHTAQQCARDVYLVETADRQKRTDACMADVVATRPSVLVERPRQQVVLCLSQEPAPVDTQLAAQLIEDESVVQQTNDHERQMQFLPVGARGGPSKPRGALEHRLSVAAFNVVQAALSAAVPSVGSVVPKLGYMNVFNFNRIAIGPGELLLTEGGVISPYSKESNFYSTRDRRAVACAGHCDVQNGPGDSTMFVPRRGDQFFDHTGSPVSLPHALCLSDGDQRQEHIQLGCCNYSVVLAGEGGFEGGGLELPEYGARVQLSHMCDTQHVAVVGFCATAVYHVVEPVARGHRYLIGGYGRRLETRLADNVSHLVALCCLHSANVRGLQFWVQLGGKPTCMIAKGFAKMILTLRSSANEVQIDCGNIDQLLPAVDADTCTTKLCWQPLAGASLCTYYTQNLCRVLGSVVVGDCPFRQSNVQEVSGVRAGQLVRHSVTDDIAQILSVAGDKTVTLLVTSVGGQQSQQQCHSTVISGGHGAVWQFGHTASVQEECRRRVHQKMFLESHRLTDSPRDFFLRLYQFVQSALYNDLRGFADTPVHYALRQGDVVCAALGAVHGSLGYNLLSYVSIATTQDACVVHSLISQLREDGTFDDVGPVWFRVHKMPSVAQQRNLMAIGFVLCTQTDWAWVDEDSASVVATYCLDQSATSPGGASFVCYRFDPHTITRLRAVSTTKYEAYYPVEQHWQVVTQGQVVGVSDETWALADTQLGSSMGTILPAGASTINANLTHECVWECCATAIERYYGDMAMVAAMAAVSRPSLSLKAGCSSLRHGLSTLSGSPHPGYTAQFLQNTAGMSLHDRLCAFQGEQLCVPGAYVAVPVGRDGNRSHAVAVVVKPGDTQVLDGNGCPTTIDLACGGQCTGLHIVQVLAQNSVVKRRPAKRHRKRKLRVPVDQAE